MTEWRYRWIRVYSWDRKTKQVVEDERNISRARYAGWEAVPAGVLPTDQLTVLNRDGKRWLLPHRVLDPAELENGGLALYRTPVENADKRAAYYADAAKQAMDTRAKSFLRDDPKGVKFAEIGVPDSDRPNRVYGANFYALENLAAHPERQKELDDYNADVAKNGRRFQGLLDQIEAEKPK